MSSVSETSSSAIHSDVVPSEVGWQFVPQYYTFVNKQPNRLHCFYTKNSTFIHGTEGEDGQPCYGQQEIHNKIMSIGFEDCKVFIHSVDAQSSAAGGIIIQVIGEMSNKGETWRKFAQTFFLAEQPNGYFVLNDIFRFLKEEGTEEDEDSSAPDVAGSSGPSATEFEQPSAASQTNFVQPEEIPNLPVAEEEPTTVLPEPESAAEAKQVNGFHEPEPEPAVILPTPPAPEPVEPAPSTPPPPAPVLEEEEPTSVEVDPAPTTAPPPATAAAPSAPTPPSSSTPAPVPAPPVAAPAPAPAPAASTPKTWASLAATGATKWGAAVSQEARGTSEAAPPSPATAAPVSAPPAAARGGAPPAGQRNNQHPAYATAMNVSTAACFVKAVTENIPKETLVNYLTTRFGSVKEVDIVRSKACAFLEFNTLDAARRAIAASLPQSQGGEGGIRIDVGEPQPARITIETRKERGERPPPRPRGGAPPNGDGRGSFRGRGAVGGRGIARGRGGWD